MKGLNCPKCGSENLLVSMMNETIVEFLIDEEKVITNNINKSLEMVACSDCTYVEYIKDGKNEILTNFKKLIGIENNE